MSSFIKSVSTCFYFQELSAYINEVKRDNEELIKINQIESQLQGYDSVSKV